MNLVKTYYMSFIKKKGQNMNDYVRCIVLTIGSLASAFYIFITAFTILNRKKIIKSFYKHLFPSWKFKYSDAIILHRAVLIQVILICAVLLENMKNTPLDITFEMLVLAQFVLTLIFLSKDWTVE